MTWLNVHLISPSKYRENSPVQCRPILFVQRRAISCDRWSLSTHIHSASVYWDRRTASLSARWGCSQNRVSSQSTIRTETGSSVGVSVRFSCRIRIQMFSAVRCRGRAARNGHTREPTRALHSLVKREKAQLCSWHPAPSNMDLGFKKRSGTILWLCLLLSFISGTFSKGEGVRVLFNIYLLHMTYVTV